MKTNGRYELKFVSQPQHRSVVEICVLLNTAGFREAYPPRKVNNFYFDTPALSAYYENLAGISHRDKIRFRWYGEERFPQAGTLEFKTKRGMLGFKESHVVENIPTAAGADWRIFRSHVEAALPPLAATRFRQSSWPVLFNSYDRRYLVNPSGSIRLTIDTAIRTWNQLRVARPNLDREVPRLDVVVVEVKAPADAREEMTEVLQHIPLRVGRFSKYCVGMFNFETF